MSTDTLVPNRVRDKWARNEVALSMTVRLVTRIEVAMIAKAAGYDSIYVDLEHSAFTHAETSQICVAALQAGLVPMVRVPTLAPDPITRVLDAGAIGIIAPHINSAAAAKEAVKWAKYPPRGQRSISGTLPHLGFRSVPHAQSIPAMDAATMVVAMIESKEGLENVEEIAAVDGVDMLFLGTADLSAELGVLGQFSHKLVEDACMRTIKAALKHGKQAGLGGGVAASPALSAPYVKAGARYISVGTDLNFLLKEATERAKAAAAISAKA